jgi:hypothetical protein
MPDFSSSGILDFVDFNLFSILNIGLLKISTFSPRFLRKDDDENYIWSKNPWS